MRLPLPLKRRVVLWLLPPGLALLYIVGDASAPPTWEAGYWTWTVAHSILLILVPAGVAEVGAAFEGSRLRKGSEMNILAVRSTALVTLNAVWPSYVCALILQLLAIVITAVQAPGGASRIPIELLAAIAAILLFHTAAGFLIGTLVPPAISVPLSLVFSYCWLGFTGTTPWMPLRHLAGLVLETCCALDEQPTLRSVAAVVVFSVVAAFGFFVAAAARLGLPSLARRTGAAFWLSALTVVLGTAVGLALAWNLGPTAATQRSSSDLRCSDGSVSVCLFPEQLTTPGIVNLVQAMVGRVQAAGVNIPNRVAAARGETTSEHIDFRFFPGMSPMQVAGSLASSFQNDRTLVCKGEGPRSNRIARRQQVGEVVRDWMILTMLGESDPKTLESVTGEIPPQLVALASLPESQQAAWIRSGLAAMSNCDVSPNPDVTT